MVKSILNIFSKPPQTKKVRNLEEEKKITADYREKNSLIVSELINLNIEIGFKELKVADYLVRDVAIERKTISDFISSMINKRLLRQLEELQQYKNRLLIVEGIDEHELYNDVPGGIKGNAIRGMIISVLLKYRVPIIFTKDYKDSAKFIYILLKRKEKELSLNVSKKNLNKQERMQFILEGFPGIGPKSAKKLLKEFGSIKRIINASEEELKEIIGKKAGVFKLIEEDY